MWVVGGISSCMALSNYNKITPKYFIVQSEIHWLLLVLILVRFFLTHSASHSGWQLVMASFEGSQKGLKVLKERGSGSPTSTLFFFARLWKVMEPLPSSLSTTCHCVAHFPKDYCHWPLPFGQSWHHSHSPWLQWLAGHHGGNRYSLSNPYSPIWEIETAQCIFSPSISPLTSPHFLLFPSVLSPMPVSCTTGPFSSLSGSQLNAWIGH